LTILKMLGKADAFTILNAALGFLAITYISDGKYVLAEALILLAVIADGVDGIVARRFGGGKAKMGDYLDIMADYLSFCVAPSILFYQVDFNVAATPLSTLPQDVMVGLAAGAFVTLGLLRLARHVAKAGPVSGRFQGLPTTGAGLFATLLIAVGGLGDIVTSLLILGAAWLMVWEAPYPKVRGPFAYASGALVIACAAVLLLPAAGASAVQVVLLAGLAGAALYAVSGLAFMFFRVPIGDPPSAIDAAPTGAGSAKRMEALEDAVKTLEDEQKKATSKRAGVATRTDVLTQEIEELRAELEKAQTLALAASKQVLAAATAAGGSAGEQKRAAALDARERELRALEAELKKQREENSQMESHLAEQSALLEQRRGTAPPAKGKRAGRRDETQEVDPDA
jgi:archaetidylserine synthase